MSTKPKLLIKGMHGLGDNLHQRALIRQLIERNDLWLESSWVAPYHDFVAQGLKVVHKRTPLRTQTKNAMREAKGFASGFPPLNHISVSYRPEEVRRRGSVLAAMCAVSGCNYSVADFRLPVPKLWLDRIDVLIAQWRPTKPILVCRPLVDRTEWNGCTTRNPSTSGYAAIFEEIRSRFFVVSIADLVRGTEWIDGAAADLPADIRLHKGELEFEMLAALFARAALVYCSPGFAVILAQAVSTPVISVFGRYERAYSFSAGARFSPYLGIEPINPCDDFKHDNSFPKTIDLHAATASASLFTEGAIERHARSNPERRSVGVADRVLVGE